ncbi:acyl-CoA dehydrogenase family protein [soil metagenome]
MIDTAEQAQFRDLARTWLEDHRPTEERPHDPEGQGAFDRAWQRTQYEGGWAGLAWPEAYGGRGLPLSLQMIWYEEYARARCPQVVDSCWLGANHAGPTLIALATEAQKIRHLAPILRGEDIWSQGFSEPGAGSDLANIQTRGVIDGDEIVITGQKIWTSYAHLSDRQELLVRTDPDSRRHHGLSWVIGDMSAAGVEVRPIMSLTGDVHNCEVFYDEVRLPLANVVGEVGQGWRVAMATLGFERSTAGFGELCELAVFLEDLIDYARETPRPFASPALMADDINGRLAQARADAQSLRAYAQMTIGRAATGSVPGAEGSIARLAQSELEQRIGRLAIDLLGLDGLTRARSGRWSHHYLFSFCQTIAGGTSEIQRNIIGERVLGLPR